MTVSGFPYKGRLPVTVKGGASCRGGRSAELESRIRRATAGHNHDYKSSNQTGKAGTRRKLHVMWLYYEACRGLRKRMSIPNIGPQTLMP